MRVDQCGQDDHTTEVDGFGAPACTDAGDPTALDAYPAVCDRRSGNR
jgi:hypothetical protein